MKPNGLRWINSLVWLLALVSGTFAQNRPAPEVGPAQLYFLSVGIETYTVDSQLPHVYGAENSARIVADALLDAGATHGILLTSDMEKDERGHAVTREDLVQAFMDLKAKIREDGALTPRIVVYVMGHGGGDPVSQYSFLVPGDAYVSPADLTQTGVARLVHTTIWNLDLISAAVNFRAHPSMDYMDDYFHSESMPNPDDPGWNSRHAQLQAKRDQIVKERRAQGVFPPEGNPPVPYLMLFDNCFGSIEKNLVPRIDFLFRFVLNNLYARMLNEGVVLYAAKPGDNESTIEVPAWVGGGGLMGPLGARLYEALQTAPPGETLAGLRSRLLSGKQVTRESDWVPHEYAVSLVPDTARAQMLPPTRRPGGTLDIRQGTGR